MSDGRPGIGPLVSVGLPVFNGEPFLDAAIDSLLAQSVEDLELIISDNASTDGTESICREFARRDERVRYVRQPVNYGSVANFNEVFVHATGRYFKWAAHDDFHDVRFLERCVGVLEQDPSVVLAYSRAHSVDSAERIVRPDWGDRPELGARDPLTRLRASLAPLHDPLPLPIFGVMRASAVRKTALMAPCPDCDRALLAELSLLGRFAEVPETLFFQREHDKRAGPGLAADSRSAVALLGGGASRFPHWRLLARHFGSVRRCPVAHGRWRLYREVGVWALRQRGLLGGDVATAATSLPLVGSLFARRLEARRAGAWLRRVKSAIADLDRMLPPSAQVVLVDDDAFAVDHINGRPATPLIVQDGVSGGPPRDSGSAAAALDARRQEGATHLVVAWPALWILDYHRDFAEHLQRQHRELRADEHMAVYELRRG